MGVARRIAATPQHDLLHGQGQVIGKNIVVIANLEPAVIRGVESQGMLLAGKDGTQIAVVEVNGLEPGTRIQ